MLLRSALLLHLWVFVLLAGCAPAVPVATGAVARSGLVAVASWIGSYLLGKGVDPIWDEVTGKPDIVELERRIRAVEGDTRFRPEFLPVLGDLKAEVSANPALNRSQFEQLVRQSVTRIEAIERRLIEAEAKLSRHQDLLDNHESRLRSVEGSPLPQNGSGPRATDRARKQLEEMRRMNAEDQKQLDSPSSLGQGGKEFL